MTTILDFVKISKIKSVAAYSLVSNEGKRLAGNHSHDVAFYRNLALFGKDASRQPQSPLGAPKAIVLEGEKSSLLVIPVGPFILGVTPESGFEIDPVLKDIKLFLERIRHQHTVSQKS